MNFVDEQHIALFEIGEKRREIAGLCNHGPRSGAEADAKLARDDLRQRGLAETGRPHEQHMVQRLVTFARGLDEDRKVRPRLLLADEFRQQLRAQRGVGRILRAAPWADDAGGRGHFANSFNPSLMSCAVSAFSPAMREAPAIAAAACGWP